MDGLAVQCGGDAGRRADEYGGRLGAGVAEAERHARRYGEDVAGAEGDRLAVEVAGEFAGLDAEDLLAGDGVRRPVVAGRERQVPHRQLGAAAARYGHGSGCDSVRVDGRRVGEGEYGHG
jgi:hypothetical protein